MVRALSRRCSIQSWGSFRIRRTNHDDHDDDHDDDNNKQQQQSRIIDTRNTYKPMEDQPPFIGEGPKEKPQSGL